MRRLLLILLLCALPAAAEAATRITAWLVCTNGTTNGMTFSINAQTRTWTNAVYYAPLQILTNDTAEGVATNLYTHLLNYPVTGIGVVMTNATTLRFTAPSETALTLGGSGDWYAVYYSTQTVAQATNVVVPYTVIPSAARSNISAALWDWLNVNPSSITAATMVAHETYTEIANVEELVVGSNGIWTDGDLTVSDEATVNSLSVSSGSASGGAWSLDGSGNLVLNGDVTIGGNLRFSDSDDWHGLNLGVTGVVATNGYFAIEDLIAANAQITTLNATTATAGNLSVSGTMSGNGAGLTNVVSRPNGSLTNQTLIGTNSLPAGSDLAFGAKALTSLSSGNNAGVPVGTNVFIRISGVSDNFTICGLNGEPNRDGKIVILYNATEYNMSFAHESGVEPVAANRIRTMSTGTESTSGEGAAMLIYSGTDSRWLLIHLQQ